VNPAHTVPLVFSFSLRSGLHCQPVSTALKHIICTTGLPAFVAVLQTVFSCFMCLHTGVYRSAIIISRTDRIVCMCV